MKKTKRQKNKVFSFFLVLLLIIASGCEKDESESNSQIVVSPAEITLNDNESAKLSFSVQPANYFEWTASAQQDWLLLNPSSGTINNDIVEIEILANPAGLSEGSHTGTVEILTNGAGKAVATVNLYVDAHPVARLHPTEIAFTENEILKEVTISNIGTGYLNWEFQNLPAWVSFNISSGAINSGDTLIILATALRSGLPMGTETAQANLSSNSEEGAINFGLSMEVPRSALIAAATDSLNFGYFEDEKTFGLINAGSVPYEWSFENNSNAFISASPEAGTLAVGDTAEVLILIDRSNFETQVYVADVSFSNNEGESLTVPVKIDHYEEQKWLIDGKIIDAEYDRVHDLIVAVSETPYEIRKLDPSTNTTQSLTLNLPPTCVSVGQNGNYAAVGHNGSFTYVDLTTMEEVEIFGVSADVFDIVLAPNDWVYVFPRTNQHVHIKCIDLSTGAVSEHTGYSIYAKTRAKLHPSGDYIYGADNGLSPSDFEKYDITNGTAQYLYDSPYHGDYGFGGDIWISDDGNRLFSRVRNVFISTTNQSTDMTYSGALTGDGYITTMDYSTNAGRIYAISTVDSWWNDTPSKYIEQYETEYLTYQGSIELSSFLVPDGTGGGSFFDPLGYFGFFNSPGNKFYVLVKIAEGSGASKEWAIATVDVD